MHIINPDAENVPPGRDFPLRLILDVWHRMQKGFFFRSFDDNAPDDRLHCDLDQAMAIANSCSPKANAVRVFGH
ncbi:hypothetical protein [Amycolatopsis sp. NPDC051128]|uniref:hypothetical protein n=1 Tax=Amycolatopsis sp. NPDC051128 TaxID=3155412 RepID=UPI003435AC9C